MIAFIVTVRGFEDESVICHESRPKAQYRVWAALRDIGYHHMFGDIRLKRAPEYDEWAARQGRPCHVSAEFVEKVCVS